jgi:hypothetical protein
MTPREQLRSCLMDQECASRGMPIGRMRRRRFATCPHSHAAPPCECIKVGLYDLRPLESAVLSTLEPVTRFQRLLSKCNSYRYTEERLD